MATYVFSDVHGHVAPLKRLLERVSPSETDRVICLGDMVDRGPDPVAVMRAVRSIPNVTVLLGNHEDLMLSFYDDPEDSMAVLNWGINGCLTTVQGMRELPDDEREELLDWVRELPQWAVGTVGDRDYIFVHAGIRPFEIEGALEWSSEMLEYVMGMQAEEDLVWIREEFWGFPTGLIGADGKGPIVIAGHTPTFYLEHLGVQLDRPARSESGLCQMVRVGASDETGGVADKWAIDCGCAGGPGVGQLLMLRLDDGQEFYEPVLEGE